MNCMRPLNYKNLLIPNFSSLQTTYVEPNLVNKYLFAFVSLILVHLMCPFIKLIFLPNEDSDFSPNVSFKKQTPNETNRSKTTAGFIKRAF